MKNYRWQILNNLLDKYEASSLYKGENTRDVKIALKLNKDNSPDYFNEYKPEYKREINEQCQSLKEKGYIEIVWKRFQEGHIIEKVILDVNNVDNVYKELNRTQKKSYESEAILVLDEYYGLDNWLGDFAREMRNRLEAGASMKKYLDIEDPESIGDIMFALSRITSQKREIPRRVFSIQLFNDSKKLERMESKLARIMIDFGGYSSDMDVLSQANIIKNPGYVYMKGSAVLRCKGERIDLERLNGEIGLSSSIIENTEVDSMRAERVVTIENLTTFHTYMPENELVIYLGGYHNEVRRKLLVKIHEASDSKPFYHWGDIDLGGFRIFNHLKKKTSIPFKPMFMDRETLIEFKDSAKSIEDERYLENLRRLLEDEEYREFWDVVEYMLKEKVRLEQEGI
jgi:hypothetical protein